MTITVKLGDIPAPSSHQKEPAQKSPESDSHQHLGLTLTPLTSDVREQLRVPDSVNGVAIGDVMDGGPAYRAGLRSGDVIVRVDHTRVGDIDALKAALKGIEHRDSIVLKVWREGEERIVSVELSGQ